MPLCSSAAAAVAIRSPEASSANSEDSEGAALATVGGSVTAQLRQPAVDQRHGH